MQCAYHVYAFVIMCVTSKKVVSSLAMMQMISIIGTSWTLYTWVVNVATEDRGNCSGAIADCVTITQNC